MVITGASSGKGFGKFKENPFSLRELSQKSLPTRKEDEYGLFNCIQTSPTPHDTFMEIADILRPEHFVDREIRESFESMFECVKKGIKVDPAILAAYMQDFKGKDQGYFQSVIMKSYDCLHNYSNAKDYASGLVEVARKRQLGEAALRILASVTDGTLDAETALTAAETEILAQRIALRQEQQRDGGLFDDIAAEIFTDLDAIQSGEKEADAVYTGSWYDFDRASKGFRPGQLVILGAPPSGGKSTTGAVLAKEFAKGGVPTIFVTLEETKKDIACKIIASESKVCAGDLTSGDRISTTKLEEARKAALDSLRGLPLAIAEPSGKTFDDVRKAIAQEEASMKERFEGFTNFRIVIIDYLQLMGAMEDVRFRTQAIDQATVKAKSMAQDMGASVICLAQYDTETARSGKKPEGIMLFADCKSIDKHADQVIMMWSPGYANRSKLHEENTIEYIWVKHRHHKNSTVQMGIDWAHSWIYPVAQGDDYTAPTPNPTKYVKPKGDWEALKKYQDEKQAEVASDDATDEFDSFVPEVAEETQVQFDDFVSVEPIELEVEIPPAPPEITVEPEIPVETDIRKEVQLELPQPVEATVASDCIEGTVFAIGETVGFKDAEGMTKVKIVGATRNEGVLECHWTETKVNSDPFDPAEFDWFTGGVVQIHHTSLIKLNE